ncbi:hypothetical protein B0J12DRAFT_665502 [Macrophomina phaseolina]|uniref:Transferase n=1 Tax=Macrophomina phaseolina TaxID=35725 RepID=A0ABQ8G8E4_9PEZI|nr:hypothetical protein B0J12DRAFT_665502 [Macrophomina phaseolina]
MDGEPLNNLKWQEVIPGRWERELDEAEQFYTSLAKAYERSGRTFFAITGHISFSVTIPDGSSREVTEQRVKKALQNAWLTLRYDHPTIASWVEYDHSRKKCKKVYEAFSSGGHCKSQQNHWLKTTFCDVTDSRTGQEWCNNDPPVPRLPTLFLLKPPSLEINGKVLSQELILRSHHDIIDGIGTLHLFNNLLAHTAAAFSQGPSYQCPIFGSEWKNLSPALRIAAEITHPPTDDQISHLQEITAYNASLRQNAELVSIPFKHGRSMPGRHQRVARTLPPERSPSRLLQACRNMGTTVTHAYHAAIAMCIRDRQEQRSEPRRVRYVNYCLIDMRKDCKEPFSTPVHPAAVYHSTSGRSLAIDLEVPAANGTIATERAQAARRKEFERIVMQIKDFYTFIRSDPEHLFMVPSYWALATVPFPDGGVAGPVPELNTMPSVSISSMGVIDKIISPSQGPFELYNPWVTGEELGTGLGLFLGTWKGQLEVSAAYNDAWHKKDDVRKNQAIENPAGD